jgi:hypothetical protein
VALASVRVTVAAPELEFDHVWIVVTRDENRPLNYARDHLAHLKCPPTNPVCVPAAENSHRQRPEVCPSRQARDFEAVTGLTMFPTREIYFLPLRPCPDFRLAR